MTPIVFFYLVMKIQNDRRSGGRVLILYIAIEEKLNLSVFH